MCSIGAAMRMAAWIALAAHIALGAAPAIERHPSGAGESDGTGTECGSDGDCVQLLQHMALAPGVRAHSGDGVSLSAGPNATSGVSPLPCGGARVPDSAQTLALIPAHGGTFGWWSLPPQPTEQLQRLQAQLSPIRGPDSRLVPKAAGTFHAGSAAHVARAMYEGTKVRAVFEGVPKKLRGVFWMRGNAIAEVLMTFQYGKWFEDEKIFISPVAPFSWAWPLGKPTSAPFGGAEYSDGVRKGMENAGVMSYRSTIVSWRFSKCPPSAKYCQHGSPDGMAYSDMQMHNFGDLSAFTDIGKDIGSSLPIKLPTAGAFTMEETPGSQDGTVWRRTCTWGMNGCATFEFGSYDLVRVVDGDGNPVEPYYSEFVRFMGGVPLLVWSGWSDSQQREANKRAAANHQLPR